MTISADSENQPKHDSAEAESLRISQAQAQEAEASFHATYSAIANLFKVKQKKYQKTFELALLEGKISIQAIAVFGILILLTFIIVATLWCLINVAIVIAVMQLSSSIWLGLLVAAGINTLLFAFCFSLMRKVKREVGFNRTKRVLKGDL
ncbi:hypothetical protein [Cognaticolwellia beringensis]|uniref:Phage holin family protein n=1 Tax=Cognaticolwellia beringensis TaxID=1967665 RepID=A0A222G4C2_9GAMM|nr:hypothetical protein [Cognaticolwellia beringensis]ASP46768.1 hypothetical protein B5D82_02610 [Cognaticolwellia beringensis]